MAAHGGDRGAPGYLLDEVDGRAPVQAVARVGMAQPVGRNLPREASPGASYKTQRQYREPGHQSRATKRTCAGLSVG